MPLDSSPITTPLDSLQDDQESFVQWTARVGNVGQVGRFLATDQPELRRGARVVVRTARGIEVGIALHRIRSANSAGESSALDGRILRRMTAEDELLWGHLQQLAEQAYDDCNLWLSEQNLQLTLLQVEPLMDGKTLYFHFLDSINSTVQSHLDKLAEVFEGRARASKFAQLLEHGCGPGCGTEKAERGCGSSGGCAVCKVANACATR